MPVKALWIKIGIRSYVTTGAVCSNIAVEFFAVCGII